MDWSQQKLGIAAALSGDPGMMEAYRSGDPYLAFAKQAGALPPDANKKSHEAEREQFKACVLAVQYGMGEESLWARIDQPVARARQLLELHRHTCWRKRRFDPGADLWLTHHWRLLSLDHERLQGHCAGLREVGRLGQFDLGINTPGQRRNSFRPGTTIATEP